MNGERSDSNPEEYDPEAEFADPESDSLTIPSVDPPEVTVPDVEVPQVEIPQVEIPQVETAESDVPDELSQGFWALVLVLNGAILALALVPMMLYFWRSLYYAGVLFAGGVVLTAFAYRRYKRLERVVDRVAADGEESEGPDDRPDGNPDRDGRTVDDTGGADQ